MTVYWNPGRARWCYNFQLGGKRHARYADDPDTGRPAANRTEAKAIEAAIRARLRAAPQAAAAPGAYTLGRALALYAARARRHANWPKIERYIAELIAFFGAATPAAAIDEAACWRFITHMREAPVTVYIGGPDRRRAAAKPARTKASARRRSDATINRRLGTLRAALNAAHRARDAHTQLPLIPAPPTVPRLKEPRRLPRPIADGDLSRIIAALRPTAPHVADAAELVRHMGFRRAEVFGLTIAHVDLARAGIWLKAEETKAGRDEFVPANPAALALLRRLMRQAERRATAFLFAWRPHSKAGTPEHRKPAWRAIDNPGRAWRRACRLAGVTHRWHDTKASFVTAIAAVASAATTQDLARHKSASTTARYLAVIDAQRRAAVDAISGFDTAPSRKQNSQTPAGVAKLRRAK